MAVLDYTLNSDAIRSNYEGVVYIKPYIDVYALMENNSLKLDEALWYQAWQGYLFLKRLPYRNDNLAAEIRRVVFKNILKGEEIATENGTAYQTSDGEIFSSFTDETLIEKMARALQECYRNAKVTHDSTADHILTTPSHLQKFLLRGKLERQSLIRLVFALGMEFEDFQKFLSKSAFIRQLSPAVPEELVLRYGILNHVPWKDIVRLKGVAEKILFELQPPEPTDEDDAPFTRDFEDDELKLPETDFVEKILRPCCNDAINKLNEGSAQYSLTAWRFVRDHSILRDVEQEMSGAAVYSDFENEDGQIISKGYDTVFLTDTVQRYAEFFSLKDYDFPAVTSGKVLSQDMYCRFLTYRIIMPNLKKGDHATKLYSMKYGELSTEIGDNILHYHEIITLPKKNHLIDRYDILVVLFYYFLMQHWKYGKNPFVAKNQNEAEELRLKFFNLANDALENTGYAELSDKNPLDLLLRISLLSVSPLEVYSRIYELNVITSLVNDSKFVPKNYPSAFRVWKTLDALIKTYNNPNLRGLQSELKELVDLKERVEKVLQRCRI